MCISKKGVKLGHLAQNIRFVKMANITNSESKNGKSSDAGYTLSHIMYLYVLVIHTIIIKSMGTLFNLFNENSFCSTFIFVSFYGIFVIGLF